MSDKFKTNAFIVIPFAIITLIIYIIMGNSTNHILPTNSIEWLKVLPYAIVLLMAILGVNVMLVLLSGTILCGFIGIFTGAFTIWGWLSAMNPLLCSLPV